MSVYRWLFSAKVPSYALQRINIIRNIDLTREIFTRLEHRASILHNRMKISMLIQRNAELNLLYPCSDGKWNGV